MPTDLSSESLASFWQWFASKDEDLFHFERNQDSIFDQLSSALEQVDSDLTFEFSPVREDGRREFVISAAGIKAAFPSVKALHRSAPSMARWRFIPFRPRRFPLNNLHYGSHQVKATDVHYAIFEDKDPSKVGLMIFFDGFKENECDTWGQIGYLFLDEALGEYDVEAHVGAILFADRTSRYFQHAHPLAQLPQHFDERLGRL